MTLMIPCVQQMQDKDPELWKQVLFLHPGEAVLVWRKTYPEDFPDGIASDAYAWDNIKPKAPA